MDIELRGCKKGDVMAAFMKTNREPDMHSIDQDLLLASEIGKSLLERNRELEAILKSTQEYAEEQAAQTDFYLKQVDVLREANESCSHACEQLDANNQQLLDKYEQQKAECKLLIGKNNRLWELIRSLERRNEELSVELNNLQDTYKEEEDDNTWIQNDSSQNNVEVTSSEAKHECEALVTISKDAADSAEMELKSENERLQKLISELRVIVKVERWHKEEVESQLDDVINENQNLHNKIASLNQEIHEWENFAEKEECYRRLAEAFSVKHNIEIEADYEGSLLASHQITPNAKTKLAKAQSCEFLNSSQVAKRGTVVKSPILLNHVLSSENSSSFLSELDSQYADLVKRYEALLEKCKQEGRFTENPERTRKVQRAIQTLSFDFSKLSSPLTSPCSKDTKTLQETCACQTATNTETQVEYRKLFSDIFAKLKESKLE